MEVVEQCAVPLDWLIGKPFTLMTLHILAGDVPRWVTATKLHCGFEFVDLHDRQCGAIQAACEKAKNKARERPEVNGATWMIAAAETTLAKPSCD